MILIIMIKVMILPCSGPPTGLLLGAGATCDIIYIYLYKTNTIITTITITITITNDTKDTTNI